MSDRRTLRLAAGIVFGSGAFWGLYWIPVRALADLGIGGAWGTAAITFAAAVLLAPVAALRRHRLATASRLALVSVAMGGAAFALYSVSFLYGRVAIVILLYFLTPVWSVLIGRVLLGWRPGPARVAAILTGLLGLGIMLGADGGAPVPRNTGEWMGLVAGLFWAVATTGIRVRDAIAPAEAAFVFAVGAVVTSLVLAPVLGALPDVAEIERPIRAVALALVTGAVWWAASAVLLMWAAPRLEPARVGILLMTEVVVGAASAAALAGEALSSAEIVGGACVLAAGVLEVRPERRSASPRRLDQSK